MTRGFFCSLVLLLGSAAPLAALQITSPAPGTTVTPGALVTVTAALGAGETATEVGVVSEGQLVPASLSGTTFSGQVRIPREAVGTEVLVVYAALAGGGVVMARVDVNVNPGPIRGLVMSVPTGFSRRGQTAPVVVRGLFQDGVYRDLSAPDLGTTYSSSNESILAVHMTGVVQARSNGTATLTVTSRGKTATSEITVAIPDADTNRIPAMTPGADQTVAAEQLVQLSVTASDPDGDALEYIWEQVGGRLVILRGQTTATPEFVSPRTPQAQVLEFLVSVKDSRGAMTLPALVRVNVTAAPPVGNE